jgi:hypothetical protein
METIVSEQPSAIYSYTEDKTQKKSHKCACEKFLFKEEDPDNSCCPTGIKDWCDFRVYIGYGNDDGCGTCAFVCFPVVFPFKLLFCFPCASYNSCRNKCNDTDDLNYIC